MTTVMVVEDDENMRVAVAAQLSAAGLGVHVCGDLAGAGRALGSHAYDCAVFDRMLPDGDSLGYVDALRRQGWHTPVLFLTARDSPADRVAGFEHGADDYLVKPFAMAELTQRVLNLCRRSGSDRPSVLRHDDLVMDCARREVRRADVLLTLSNKEFAVLEYLLVRSGQAVSRAELLEHCWAAAPEEMGDKSNPVDAVVKRLRRKLREPELIHAVRGLGYRFGAQ